MLYLTLLNKRHARQRQQAGKSANLVDEWMMHKDKVRSGKAVAIELEDTGRPDATAAIAQDKAFDDTTDLKNEDFIYVY